VNAQPDEIQDDETSEPLMLRLPPDLAELKLLVTCYYATQEHRIKIGNRVWALTERLGVEQPRAECLHWRLMGGTYEGAREKGLLDVEHAIALDIGRLVRDQALWREWLRDVRGIGPILAGGFISGVGDVGRFDTVSKLWAYCGLHTLENPKAGEDGQPDRVGARRARGERANWSPFLRTLAWKAGESFVKTKGGYRDQYDRQREKYQRTRPETSDGHRHAMAKRATVKLFLSHLWEEWRTLEGLPLRDPYVLDQLGHTTRIAVIRK
jgi:hypothetical protein